MMKLIDYVWIYLVLFNCLFYFCEPFGQEGPVYQNRSARLTFDEPARNKRADEDSCILPARSLDKTISLKCPYEPCNAESGYVPSSTVASISCKPNFFSEKKASVCSNRTWSPPIEDCFKCGRVHSNNTHTFENPWHVAIYYSKNSLICSGTIISPYLVLTAAHCFPESDIVANNMSKYEVVTSKVTRNYNIKDNDNQKSYKIKEIKFSYKGYLGPIDQYSSDIAVLVLEEKLEIGEAVLPVCVDWIEGKPDLAEGTPVKVSGWGVNERGALSEDLQKTGLKFVGRQRCWEMVPSDFRQYLTFDKFCATAEGGKQGQSVMQGNGGAGLLFRENSSSIYIRGIVSLIQPNTSKLATFTDLADHITWITTFRNEIENRTSAKKITPNKDVPLTPAVPLPATTIAPNLTRIPSEIAATNCLKYSKPVTQCIKEAEPRVGEFKTAMDKEFPYMAVIGCGSDTNSVYGCLMGSLISESFILSMPPKDPNTVTKFALLGYAVKYGLWRSSPNDVHVISKCYIHPDYKFPFNSIALYKLQTPVTLKPWSTVRPACLHSSPDFNVFNEKFITASWGNSRLLDRGIGSTLFKTTAVVIDDKQCSSTYEGAYDPKSMICIANWTKNEDYSMISEGAPIQALKENTSCTWMIYAIHYGHVTLPDSCNNVRNAKPQLFTKIYYYLDWIQGIVWP